MRRSPGRIPPPEELPGAASGGPLSYKIFQLARAHRGCADRLLGELGLQPGHEHLLLSLYERDHQSRSELLDVLGLDDPTIGESLSCLVDLHLVRLDPGAGSQLGPLVRLTEAGRALRSRVEEVRDCMDAAAMEALGDQAEAFVATARVIETAIRQR